MTPGPNQILRLPHSSTLVKVMTLASGNTFGSKYWTDGKRESPMWPIQWPVLRHPISGEVFWRDDCDHVADESPWDNSNEYTDVPYADDATLDDLLGVLSNGEQLTPERERTLRLFAWWEWNEPARSGKPPPNDLPDFRHNLRRLESLVEPGKDADRVMLAEIARELGDFERSVVLLEAPFPEKYGSAIAVIRGANERSDPQVLQIV